MSRVILCLGTYANTPFYLERACLHLYSIEELCFYLYENAYLLDKDIMNIKLVEWIKNECNLPELAKELTVLIRKKDTLCHFVLSILKYAFYCNETELREVCTLIKENESLNITEKRKSGIDYLVRKRKFTKALREYKLLMEEIGETDDMLKSKIIHNMGVILANLFDFKSAAVCFLKAYELSYEPDCYISFLAANRMSMNEKDYVEFIASNQKHYQMSMEVEKRVEQMQAKWIDYTGKAELDEIKAYRSSQFSMTYYEKVVEMIDSWKDDYRSYNE